MLRAGGSSLLLDERLHIAVVSWEFNKSLPEISAHHFRVERAVGDMMGTESPNPSAACCRSCTVHSPFRFPALIRSHRLVHTAPHPKRSRFPLVPDGEYTLHVRGARGTSLEQLGTGRAEVL